MAGEPRYETAYELGQRIGHTDSVACADCGAFVMDVAAHTRFHSILSSHAWMLAVLKTSHIAVHVHDKYDVVERIDSKKFDNWSADALAEVIAGMPADDAEGGHLQLSEVNWPWRTLPAPTGRCAPDGPAPPPIPIAGSAWSRCRPGTGPPGTGPDAYPEVTMLAILGIILLVIAAALKLVSQHLDLVIWLIIAGGILIGAEVAWGWNRGGRTYRRAA